VARYDLQLFGIGSGITGIGFMAFYVGYCVIEYIPRIIFCFLLYAFFAHFVVIKISIYGIKSEPKIGSVYSSYYSAAYIAIFVLIISAFIGMLFAIYNTGKYVQMMWILLIYGGVALIDCAAVIHYFIFNGTKYTILKYVALSLFVLIIGTLICINLMLFGGFIWLRKNELDIVIAMLVHSYALIFYGLFGYYFALELTGEKNPRLNTFMRAMYLLCIVIAMVIDAFIMLSPISKDLKEIVKANLLTQIGVVLSIGTILSQEIRAERVEHKHKGES